ncbi:MAG TPA: ABC transporter ATP-binding protein [Gemmatimonadales bacterium]|jgi:ABC-2 type transport system ATP-binding protein|nr:ABC transporter ATP-binding protein [Gemmatimonadales bacterium]
MSHAIEVRELHYRAGKTFEIRDFALSVPTGSLYGFLGPNGSGKTTTIRLLLGLLRPLGGRIAVLGGEVPRDIPRILARTGYVPEQPHLYPTVTVAEAMRFHAAFYTTWDWPWADDLTRQFQLDRDSRLGQLSKGEMGKLEMLLALAQRPELLVLDEPTDGLDPVVRRDVLAALLDYVSQQNATVFISSHLVHELERICDWVGVMDRGRLVAELPMQSFKNGIKRLRVANPPALPGDTPFVLLARETANGALETWTVRGWQAPMGQYFEGVGASLREVIDLDLEEGFVELLRTFREPRS